MVRKSNLFIILTDILAKNWDPGSRLYLIFVNIQGIQIKTGGGGDMALSFSSVLSELLVKPVGVLFS